MDPETPPFAPDPTAACCGKPWIEHPGIIATCKELQQATAQLAALKEIHFAAINECAKLRARLAELTNRHIAQTCSLNPGPGSQN